MYSRTQFVDLAYMGGTGPCEPMTIILGSVIYSYLQLVCKPKYQIWCESDVPCTQDSSLPIYLLWEVPDSVDR